MHFLLSDRSLCLQHHRQVESCPSRGAALRQPHRAPNLPPSGVLGEILLTHSRPRKNSGAKVQLQQPPKPSYPAADCSNCSSFASLAPEAWKEGRPWCLLLLPLTHSLTFTHTRARTERKRRRSSRGLVVVVCGG